MAEIEIARVEHLSECDIDALADILISTVAQGASVGFLPPLDREEARAYWHVAIASETVVLLIARRETSIVGTVQLEWSAKKNARHRAEVAKLLVHPDAQRLGIGRRLMEELETIARANGWMTLYLDTREGDTSNDFYRSQRWIRAGVIPQWAESADGTLDGTVFYYKLLSSRL